MPCRAPGADAPLLCSMDAIRTDALTKHYKVGFWRPRPYVALDSVPSRYARARCSGFSARTAPGRPPRSSC